MRQITVEHPIITASFSAVTISILTDQDQVQVPSGRTTSLQVKLSDDPQTNMVVRVGWQSGSTAISVRLMDSLTFALTNWNIYQTIQLGTTSDRIEMNPLYPGPLKGVGGR